MLCIQLKSKDPFYCLAAEEYLLKNFTDDIFLLWQSTNTVVVGKHQNAMAEINHRYVYNNNICISRRISGGGTVYHDEGNLNFGYILNVSGPSEISFPRFMKPVIEALGRLNVKAETSGRNDLLVDGKKVSGNAEHIYKNRVLHHGTLLFNSNLETLGNSIKVTPGKYFDKAVQSKRSTVANLFPGLKGINTLDEFGSFLLDFHLEMPGSSVYELTEDDILTIEKLAEEKFSTWDWNFGYSPKYVFKNESIINGKQLQVELQVEKGVIQKAELQGNYFSGKQAAILQDALIGERHFYADIRQNLKQFYIETTDDLVFAFF